MFYPKIRHQRRTTLRVVRKGVLTLKLTAETEDAEGTVIVKIRKAYNENTDVSEYFGL